MQKIREQQEMSVYGQKVVSLDSDDDEDTPIMVGLSFLELGIFGQTKVQILDSETGKSGQTLKKAVIYPRNQEKLGVQAFVKIQVYPELKNFCAVTLIKEIGDIFTKFF